MGLFASSSNFVRYHDRKPIVILDQNCCAALLVPAYRLVREAGHSAKV